MSKAITAVALLLLAALGTPAVGSEPTLQRAEFFSHTNDDNKDHDTGVYVYVKTKDGKSELAKVENADNSPNDETEYNDGSDHTVPLVVIAPGTTKSVCDGFAVTIKQHTNGKDTWKFNGKRRHDCSQEFRRDRTQERLGRA